MQRPDGRLEWPDGEDALTSRVYTIRAVDQTAGTLAVDFALHEGGHSPGADFARRARPGDAVGLLGPGGDGRPEGKRLLLLGDEAALPAIARMIAELPQGTAVSAIVEVADASEEQALPGAADLTLRWLHRGNVAPGRSSMLEAALEAHLAQGPLQEDFIWAGCEKAAAARIRSTLLARYLDWKKAFLSHQPRPAGA